LAAVFQKRELWMRVWHAVLISVLFSTSMLCFGAAPKQLAELTASDGTSSDSFGAAVAVSGNVVVVGAPEATVKGNGQEGAAYVFVKPAGGWTNMTQVAKLTPSGGAPNEYFGASVAISGDTIVIGTGAYYGVFVFVKPKSGWMDVTETAVLSVVGMGPAAIDGDTIVGGAPTYRDAAVYVFLKPKKGWVSTSQPNATLTESNGVAGDGFGMSVGVSGSTIAAAAADIGNGGTGTGYIFIRQTSRWEDMTETAKLTASDGSSGHCFACSLAISGNSVLVGALGTGAAYVFVEPLSGWVDMTETAELTNANGSYDNGFGWAVAINRSKALAGSPYGGNDENEGAAYLYRKPKSGWERTSQFTAELLPSDPIAGNSFALSVAMSGGTILVGATKLPISPGAAYVF
jgi:hypothetical protein